MRIKLIKLAHVFVESVESTTTSSDDVVAKSDYTNKTTALIDREPQVATCPN